MAAAIEAAAAIAESASVIEFFHKLVLIIITKAYLFGRQKTIARPVFGQRLIKGEETANFTNAAYLTNEDLNYNI